MATLRNITKKFEDKRNKFLQAQAEYFDEYSEIYVNRFKKDKESDKYRYYGPGSYAPIASMAKVSHSALHKEPLVRISTNSDALGKVIEISRILRIKV